jgi:hypothetical protein
MISPFDCVAAQDMGMAGAERKSISAVIASEAKQSRLVRKNWIASSLRSSQ